MKKYLIYICLHLVFTSSIYAAKATPDQFAGSDGLLDEQELIEFLLVHNKKTFHDVWNQKPSQQEIADEDGNIEQAKKKKLVRFDLLEIQERENSMGPYTPQQIQAQKTDDDKHTIPGFLGESLNSGDTNYGPILLRQKFEDWNKNIYTVSGASISYTNDRIENTRTWQTQGSIIYPILRTSQRTREKRDQAGPVYSELVVLPSIEWKYLTNIEELTFRLPIDYSIQHNQSWSSDFYFSPFYTTDFDFDGSMIGADLKYEPTVQIGRRFQTGSWHSLFGGPGVAYLFRVIPGLTYSEVLSESSFINREENDNIFAITTSLELRLMPFGKNTPWEFHGSYDLLYDFTEDSDGYSDKWNVGSSWWFTKNIGLDLEYQKGNMPLTNKEIDLVTFGLKVRL